MFCSKCNQLNLAEAKFCNKCGNNLTNSENDSENLSSTDNISGNNNATYYRPVDNPSHFAGFISCCFPVVGLILYFIWKDEKPNSSKLICEWMIAGVVAYILIYILFLIVGFAFAGAGATQYYY